MVNNSVNNSALRGQESVLISRCTMTSFVPKMVRVAFTPAELNYLERLEPFRRAEQETVDLEGFERLCVLGNDLLLLTKGLGTWSGWVDIWPPKSSRQNSEN
jgi:hypothetical protein